MWQKIENINTINQIEQISNDPINENNKYCTNCGTELTEFNNFCSSCGVRTGKSNIILASIGSRFGSSIIDGIIANIAVFIAGFVLGIF